MFFPLFLPILFPFVVLICGFHVISPIVVALSVFSMLFLHKKVPNIHFGWFKGILGLGGRRVNSSSGYVLFPLFLPVLFPFVVLICGFHVISPIVVAICVFSMLFLHKKVPNFPFGQFKGI